MLSTSWNYRKAMTRSNLILDTGTWYLPDNIYNSTNKCILGLKNGGESYLEHDYLYYKACLNFDRKLANYIVYIPIVIPDGEFCIFDLTFINNFVPSDYDFAHLDIHICVFDPRNSSIGHLNDYAEMDQSDYTYSFSLHGDTFINSLNLSGGVGFDAYQIRYNYYAADGPTNILQDL